MNIEIRSKAVAFVDLYVGDGFIFANDVFIKIVPLTDNRDDLVNAVSLKSGDFAYFDNTENVTRVNKMILE